MKSLLFGILLALASGVGASPRVEIALRPEVTLGRSQVLLGDVAVLRTGELELLRKLVELPVGRLTMPGASLVLVHAGLQERIRSLAGVSLAEQAWTGPPEVRVSAPAQQVRGDEVAGAAEAALRRRFPAAQPHLAQAPRDIVVWPGSWRIQPRSLDHVPTRTRVLVWVDVWSGDRHVRALPVTFDLAAPIRDDRRVPLSDAGGHLEIPPKVAEESGPAVSRGQWVVLRTAIGQIHTEARVQVLQGGRTGEAVQIRHSGGAEGLIVRVAGPGRVEMP